MFRVRKTGRSLKWTTDEDGVALIARGGGGVAASAGADEAVTVALAR